MTDRHLCIHGHFYQPPREDPWLGAVLPEGSAAPRRDWNARITRESYAPLSRARLLDAQGRIRALVNAYEFISFNFGPTLLAWMAREAPETYELVLEADRASRARLGFGNAMAQIRHHTIMPLASAQDKRVETAWAVQDFESRYGRSPDGLWLPEAAADTASLEALAEAGIAYTVLAPRQAAAVADPGGPWQPVSEATLDITRPYRAELPSGRSIAVFFYHGALSQAVAFERLLTDGGAFWSRLRAAAAPGLVCLATDGETYGHHFTFGEMALAWCLEQAQADPSVRLTNFAAHLAAHPPVRLVRLHEPSSWSCAHGVERWRADCGCHTGDHPGWNQAWRAPLREALCALKERLDAHYAQAAPALLRDPDAGLRDYGQVIADPARRDAFAAAHLAPGLDPAARQRAWDLLAMQRHALASFASCAWFFDDLDRIEPVNALTNALRACELAGRTEVPGGAQGLEAGLEQALAQARSNPCPRHPQGRTGDAILRQEARPRHGTPASLALHALLLAWAQSPDLPPGSSPVDHAWPDVRLAVRWDAPAAAPGTAPGTALAGTARITHTHGEAAAEHALLWEPPTPAAPWASRLRLDGGPWLVARDLPWNKRQDIALAFAAASADAQCAALAARAATARALTLPPAEAQATQNQADSWQHLLPALAQQWIASDADAPGDETLRAMLAASPWPPAAREELSRTLNQTALALLAAPEPDWPALGRLAARAQALDAQPDWWPTQNRIWALAPGTPEARAAARQFGFAMP
ncbi:DUF3536 domain-containing protein [Desulfocurvus sp.]|uniref:DUF3536 domain-containing protein n=1 Tax=Desulfocurvus sp. TaxID=2871698 RepID=UPI0025C086F8|nr:DUF3536 domain-containing protein [Desulfocurvus sp.]MCK9239821.1 DUF3536 domain-containing protein [Desulfocurvus sp.]